MECYHSRLQCSWWARILAINLHKPTRCVTERQRTSSWIRFTAASVDLAVLIDSFPPFIAQLPVYAQLLFLPSWSQVLAVCGGFHRSEWVTPVERWTNSTTSRESGGVSVFKKRQRRWGFLWGVCVESLWGPGGSWASEYSSPPMLEQIRDTRLD